MEDLKHKNFWKHIIENKDGSLNKEQVYKELEDYSELMDRASKVYMEVRQLSPINKYIRKCKVLLFRKSEVGLWKVVNYVRGICLINFLKSTIRKQKNDLLKKYLILLKIALLQFLEHYFYLLRSLVRLQICLLNARRIKLGVL